MPEHKKEKYLTDILIYIGELETFSHQINIGNIEQPINKWSVERALSIIGEALSQADKLDKGLLITSKQQIIGLRHILVHDYDKIDAQRLLVILNRHLPLLKEEIENILNQKD
jgi:uncharacterized protein with HEPN domain